MGNNNNFMGDGGERPVNLPNPADAWLDMRARLDDEMPVGGALPLPGGGIINVDNTLFRSVTLLFLLLLLSCPVLFFTGKNAGGSNAGKPATPAAAQHSTPLAVASDEISKNTQPTVIADTAGAAKGPGNNINKITANPHTSPHNKTRPKQTIPLPTAQSAPAGNTINNNTNTPATQAGNQPVANTAMQPPPEKQPVQAGDKTTLAPGDDADKKEENNDDTTQWQAGLWWKAQGPFSGAKHYVDGPNGKSQPYRLLIPGFWVAMQHGHDMLDAELNVFASTVYKPQQFYGYYTIPTPTTNVAEQYKLTKTFGVSLGLGYSYNIGGNWWAGGNVQFTALTAAANVIDSTITNVTANNITYRSGTGKVNDTLWADFNKLQVRLGAQLLYKTNHWQAGIRTGVYFMSPMSRYNTVHNPLETELFFRWGLWRWKK